MTDWVFAFAVNMGSAEVTQGTDEYDQAASALNQPGDYSIKRLYLDFSCKVPSTQVVRIVN
jgi:hypothetical protein